MKETKLNLNMVNSAIKDLTGEGGEDAQLKINELQQILQKGALTKEFTNKAGEKQTLTLKTKDNELIGKVEGGRVDISKNKDVQIWVKTEDLKQFKAEKTDKVKCEVVSNKTGEIYKAELQKKEFKISIKPLGKIGIKKTVAFTKELKKGENQKALKEQNQNIKANKPKTKKIKMSL